MEQKYTFLIAGWIALLCCAGRVLAADTFKVSSLAFYQPDQVLRARIPDLASLADYVKRLESAGRKHFSEDAPPADFAVVMAVKPEGKARGWFVPKIDDAVSLQKKLEAITPPQVFGGPVALALVCAVNGGSGKAPKADAGAPIPEEWKDAVMKSKKEAVLPDGPLSILWPDTGPAVNLPPTPTEFVVQVLEPTGGRIERPKGWHYEEGHRGSALMWTLKKEDNKDGSYTTGVRIQMFVGLRERAGKSPKDFIQDFIKTKRKSDAVKTVRRCDAENQGLFSKECLEITEGPHHVLYSLFWGNDLDMAVVMIAGTSHELWPVYAPVFDRMNRFELIDMKRLQK